MARAGVGSGSMRVVGGSVKGGVRFGDEALGDGEDENAEEEEQVERLANVQPALPPAVHHVVCEQRAGAG